MPSPLSQATYQQLAQPRTIQKLNHRQVTEIIYNIFIFIITLLLIGLAMRILFALLLMDSAFSRGVTIFTEPFIMPFNTTFRDSHEMVQISTAAAFTSYYFIYAFVSITSKLFNRNQRIASKTF